MLKQSFSRTKKVLTILLAVFVVVSLTVGAASACGSHGHHEYKHMNGHKYISNSCNSDTCYSCSGATCDSCIKPAKPAKPATVTKPARATKLVLSY